MVFQVNLLPPGFSDAIPVMTLEAAELPSCSGAPCLRLPRHFHRGQAASCRGCPSQACCEVPSWAPISSRDQIAGQHGTLGHAGPALWEARSPSGSYHLPEALQVAPEAFLPV